jgi:PPIC-type peptidyl-prolyl cis-trans isomerase-like protein
VIAWPWTSIRSGLLIVGLAAVGIGACKSEPAATKPTTTGERVLSHLQPAGSANEDGAAPLAVPYPPGRWRLARMEDLAPVVLWVSHILVRHQDVQPGIVSFQLSDWTPSPPPPARTLEEAFALAERLRLELRADPSQFSKVAREYSEDISTRAGGGSMGGIGAAELYRFPEVLDTLAAIAPGEVSRVVETSYGFHIFQRRLPPFEETVSGARVVIAYDEAPWLGAFLARRTPEARSRADALELAQSLYERARRGEAFEHLVNEYSDHREALRGGDFGAWSTREPTPFPREVEILAGLKVGDVSVPLDSPFGVQIIKRTASRQRELYAMTTVQQRFDASQKDTDPASGKWVLRNMHALSDEIEKNPARFAELQNEYCCLHEEQWMEGRGEAQAEAVLAKLRYGEVGREPVQVAGAYAIVRRELPKPVTVPVLHELPAPENPDLRHFALQARMTSLRASLATTGVGALGLKGVLAEQFVALHQELGQLSDAELPDDRVAQFDEAQRRVAALLGETLFAKYVDLLHERATSELLQSSATPRGRVMSGSPVPVP